MTNLIFKAQRNNQVVQKIKSTLRKEIKIQNTVSTADLKQKIKIELFNKYKYLSSNLELYRCGYVKDNKMVGRVTVFANGKLISVGTKSPEEAEKELRLASKILQKYKLSKSVKIIPQVRNIVAGCELGKKLPIEKLARTLPKCMYEPEQFPGIIYRIHDSCVALLFSSGKGVIVGAKSVEEINSAFFEIIARIKND